MARLSFLLARFILFDLFAVILFVFFATVGTGNTTALWNWGRAGGWKDIFESHEPDVLNMLGSGTPGVGDDMDDMDDFDLNYHDEF